MFWCVSVQLGQFGCLTNVGGKRAELVQKFVPQSSIGIFCNERTRSTPLEPKLLFWCVLYHLVTFGTVWLPYETVAAGIWPWLVGQNVRRSPQWRSLLSQAYIISLAKYDNNCALKAQGSSRDGVTGLIHVEAQFIREAGSDCRKRPDENGRPGHIRTPFGVFYIWMES